MIARILNRNPQGLIKDGDSTGSWEIKVSSIMLFPPMAIALFSKINVINVKTFPWLQVITPICTIHFKSPHWDINV